MKATGTFTKQDGSIFVVNDTIPAIPLEDAQELYREGKLEICGSHQSVRSRLVRLIVGTEAHSGRPAKWVTGMSKKEMASL